MRTYTSQVIDIPFAEGVDQDTDPVLAKGMLEAENVRFERTGSFSKRYGWSQNSLASSKTATEYLGNAYAPAAMRTAADHSADVILPTGEHAVLGDHCYRQDPMPQDTDWVGVGIAPRLIADAYETGTSAAGQADIAVDLSGNRYCVVYTRITYKVGASSTAGPDVSMVWAVFDTPTNTRLFMGEKTVSSTDAPGRLWCPKVVFDGTRFHIAYSYSNKDYTTSASGVYLFTVDPSTGLETAPFLVHTATGRYISIALLYVNPGYIFVAGYYPSGSSSIRVSRFTFFGGVYTAEGTLDLSGTNTFPVALDMSRGAFTGDVRLSAAEHVIATGALAMTLYTFGTNLLFPRTYQIDSTNPYYTHTQSTGVLEVSATRVFVYFDNYAYIVDGAGTSGNPPIVTWRPSTSGKFVGLSDPFLYVDTGTGTTQPDYFGVNVIAAVGDPGTTTCDIGVVRFEWKNALITRTAQLFPLGASSASARIGPTGGAPYLTAQGGMTSVVSMGGGKYLAAVVPYVTFEDFAFGLSVGTVNVTTLDTTYTPPRMSADNGATSVITGGMPVMFDKYSYEIAGSGQSRIVTLTPAATPAGMTTNCRYAYAASIRMQSPVGTWHRYGVSEIRQVDMGANTAMTIGCEYVAPLDSGQLPGAKYFLEVWRSVGNGSTFYRLVDFEIAAGSGSVIVFKEAYSDITIQTREQLQIPDGATSFTPVQPPSCKGAWFAGQRYWLTECIDGSTYYSQVVIGNEVPVFNPALRIPSTDSGNIIAVHELDRNIIALTTSGVTTIVFDGEAPTVLNVQSPTGCSNRHSAVKGGLGIYFAGPDGMYMIDRSIAVSRVDSAAMYIPDTSKILCAEYNDAFDEATFFVSGTTGTGFVAIACSEMRGSPQWIKFTVATNADEGYEVRAAKYSRVSSRLHYLTRKSCYGFESRGTYLDGYVGAAAAPNKWITMRARTPWASPGGIQGYMRTWRAGLKFTNFGWPSTATDLVLEVFEDHVGIETANDVPIQTRRFVAVEDLVTYKDTRAMLRLKRQKCHAVSIRFRDAPPNDDVPSPTNTGRGVRVQALSLELQVEGGTHGLPKGQRG